MNPKRWLTVVIHPLIISAITGCYILQQSATPTPVLVPKLPPTEGPTITQPPDTTSTIPPRTKSPSPSPDILQLPASLRRDPVPLEAIETVRTLESIDYPIRDLIDLTLRLKYPGRPIPRVVRDEPWGFEIGETHDFWVVDWDTNGYYQVTARLVYETAHTYIFVQEGVDLNEARLHRWADRFEAETYPTNRKFFGSEWSPGVDNDPHLTILLLSETDFHYQNSIDEFSRLVNRYSNEMEIIYIGASDESLDDDCILAHEFQHMIQWAVDYNEETWIFEGFSELACPINGLNAWYSDYISGAFAQQPDTQLNTWKGESSQVPVQYGASYLFMAYFLDRFGEEITRALIAHPENGVAGVDAALEDVDAGIGFDDVFADWVVANYVKGDGPYGYSSLTLPSFVPVAEYRVEDLPVEEQTSVGQYAADYIVLHGEGRFRVDFAGATLVGLAPISAHSGKCAWWGGRGTNSDTMLTREFDLGGLKEATLVFYTWYDLDKDYDYAYVEASVDGEVWKTLPGQTSTNKDPNGANFGNGYTGASQGWIREEIDLTLYAGQKVHIRFEYLTDDGPVHDGIFLDDIEIPELGYRDDAETGAGGWAARGFIRNAIFLPQEWLLQLVMFKYDQMTLERLQLDPDNTGRWTVDLGPGETAVLIVSGRTRVTIEPAEYWYRYTTDD